MMALVHMNYLDISQENQEPKVDCEVLQADL
jgi:hypothetical protein